MSGADSKFGHVAVLMGGPSAERPVSLVSGAAVSGALREAGYRVSEVDPTPDDLRLPAWVDAVFIALHGTFGEDGGVQRLLDEAAIPYTGSGARASAISFDKILSKEVFEAAGIPTPAYEVVDADEAGRLLPPFVVKPPRQGSSIGISRVFDESARMDAIAEARQYGSDVLLEAYIEGRELTVGVVGDDVLPVVEIVAPDGDYNYDKNYTSGKTEYLAPAELDGPIAEACSRWAGETFRALGCRGFARVDFRLSADGELFVLELNTIPGFTATSLLPKGVRVCGN